MTTGRRRLAREALAAQIHDRYQDGIRDLIAKASAEARHSITLARHQFDSTGEDVVLDRMYPRWRAIAEQFLGARLAQSQWLVERFAVTLDLKNPSCLLRPEHDPDHQVEAVPQHDGILAQPDLESEQDFIQKAIAHYRERRSLFAAAGLSPYRKAPELLEHARWFVDHYRERLGLAEIADRESKSSEAIRDGIRRFSDLVTDAIDPHSP